MSQTQLQSNTQDLSDDELALLSYFLQAEGVDLAPARSIPVQLDRAELPLSFAQQRLWFLHQLDPQTTAYNNLMVVRLSGELDVALLEHSFNQIIRRHEVLRTTFDLAHGNAVQVIHPAATFKVAPRDLQHLPAAEQTAAIARYAIEDVNRPFDLSRDIFLRATLLKLGIAEHILGITLHHIIWDAQSAKILFAELEAFYRAGLTSQTVSVPPLAIQYADFAAWQRKWLRPDNAHGALEQQLSYWKQQLGGSPALLTLPTDYPRPVAQSFRGASQPCALPAAETEALDALSRREGCTLFMVLLAAFEVLLSYSADQTDIVVGTDVSDRNHVETEPLIGFFVNQLALRVNVGGDPNFRELLKRVRTVVLEAFAHRDVPIEQVVQALQIERRLDYAPLFQVKFYLMHGEEPQLRLPGITVAPLDIDSQVSRHDLTFALSRLEHGLGGYINYNADLFRPSTIDRFNELYKAILTQVATDPDLTVGQLMDTLERITKEKRVMERAQREESNFKKFKRIERKTVSLSQADPVKLDELQVGDSSIALIVPQGDVIDLADWARSNRDLIEAQVLKHGAALFRGFNVNTSPAFELFALVICREIFKENSEHTPVSTNGNVQTPVFYPPYKKLLWHNENTFNHSWPMKIMFGCVRPAQEGGETPLVDSRRVYERIPAAIREEFRRKQIMYVRNYGEGLGLDWQTVFRTTSKAEVEDLCRRTATEFEWRGGDRLRTRQVRSALGKHPQTGEMVWFNQALHWHVSCLDETTRASMTAIFTEEDLPRNCYYGDGSLIDDAIIQEMSRIYEDVEITFAWHEGDVIVVDNMLMAHARNPFVGERKLLVAMGEMINHEMIES